jgi:hypothetical protein
MIRVVTLLLDHKLSQGESERFWAKVEKTDECWNWTAALDRKGYGHFGISFTDRPRIGGRLQRSMASAHRISYIQHFGAIPVGDGFHGVCVLHRCDNPRCVRPDHLFIGTNRDNVRDMDAKGRRVNAQLRGSMHGNAVLSEGDVREIVRRYRAGGITQKQLGVEFSVAHSTINHIFTGRLWAHLGLSGKGSV